MSKRYSSSVSCEQEGCKESASYRFSTQRDLKEWQRARKPWFCQRHKPDGSNLNVNSQPRTHEKIIECVHPEADKYPSIANLHTWTTGSGFAHGDTWNAYASDFPIGAKVVITTTIEVILPEAPHTCVWCSGEVTA